VVPPRELSSDLGEEFWPEDDAGAIELSHALTAWRCGSAPAASFPAFVDNDIQRNLLLSRSTLARPGQDPTSHDLRERVHASFPVALDAPAGLISENGGRLIEPHGRWNNAIRSVPGAGDQNSTVLYRAGYDAARRFRSPIRSCTGNHPSKFFLTRSESRITNLANSRQPINISSPKR